MSDTVYTHEAGHVVLAEVLGVQVVRVTAVPDGDSAGTTSFLSSPETPAQIAAAGAVRAAGDVDEELAEQTVDEPWRCRTAGRRRAPFQLGERDL